MKPIGYLPKLLPFESIYSWLARIFDHLQVSNRKEFIKRILGKPYPSAVMDFPNGLDNLCRNLQISSLSSDYLIDNHTLLPVFSPFLPPHRLQAVRNKMKSDIGNGIHTQIGLVASRIPMSNTIYLCVLCVESDRVTYGECYIHLDHQVIGTFVCAQHKIGLTGVSLDLFVDSIKYEFISAERLANAVVFDSPTQIQNLQMHSLLANEILWLLQSKGLMFGPESLRKQFLRLLADNDLATYSGRMRASRFVAAFCNYYPEDFLKSIHCTLDPEISDNWLLRLVRSRSETQSPIQYILLIHFLGINTQTFFSALEKPDYFGSAPYPCLNKCCEHYQENVIEFCDVNFYESSGKPTGIFKCQYCGFTYLRKGPDKSLQDRNRIGKIVDFGPVWCAELKRLYNTKCSLRSKARQLGVDTTTVKRQAHKLNIILTTSRPLASKTGNEDDAQKQQKKNEWLELCQKYPDLSRTQLRQLNRKLYMWLFRNDRVWLQNNPKRTKATYHPVNNVDWELRDDEYSWRSVEAFQQMLLADERPRWISRTAIARKAKILGAFEKHPDKIPQTIQLINGLSETLEAFAFRRVDYAISLYRAEGINPKRWQVIQRAGVDRYKSNENLLDYIERNINNATQ